MIALPQIPLPTSEAERIRIAERLATPSTHKSVSAPVLRFKHVPPHALDLSQSFLDAHRMSTQARGSTVMYSILVHGVVLAAALLIPMWFANTLDIQTYTRTLLVAPPPPPPGPAAPSAEVVHAASPAPRRQVIAKGQLLLPTHIPKHVAIFSDSQEAPDVGGGGGVSGGVAGGVPGGILGGILSAGLEETNTPPAPVAPAPSMAEGPRAPLRVGGQVKAPRAIYTPQPEYPVLARQARIEGVVQIDAIVDEHGNVTKMHAERPRFADSGSPRRRNQVEIRAYLSEWRTIPRLLDGERNLPYGVCPRLMGGEKG